MPIQQGVRSAYQLRIHDHEDASQGGHVSSLTQDTVNGDVPLIPNGTGYVRFGLYVVMGAEMLAGYIQVRDALGNIRKIAVVA